MLFYIAQEEKKPTEAVFYIQDAQRLRVGKIRVTGWTYTTNFAAEGTAWEHEFSLSWMPGHYVNTTMVHDEKAFRPYLITLDGEESGVCYQVDEKTDSFKKRSIQRLWLGEAHYEKYTVFPGQKSDGYCPVFRGSEQTAAVVIPWILRDPKFAFQIISEDAESAMPALLMEICTYGTEFFCAGNTGQRVQKRGARTTDVSLLSRYDPAFLTRFGDAGALPWRK